MNTTDSLIAEQTIDAETDADLRSELERERARPRDKPSNDTLTADEYRSRRRPQSNLRAGPSAVYADTDPTERYDGGSDRHDPGVKRAQGYRPSAAVSNDLVNEGHGFTSGRFERFSNPDLLEICRFCGDRLLAPDETSPCEFAIPTHKLPLRVGPPAPTKYGVAVRFGPEAPGWTTGPGEVRGGAPLELFHPPDRSDPAPAGGPLPETDSYKCRCNGCKIRREGKRKRGGQPVQCGKPACQAALRKEENDRSRALQRESQRLAAIDLIRTSPDLDDELLAEKLGCRKIRIKEARQRILVDPILLGHPVPQQRGII